MSSLRVRALDASDAASARAVVRTRFGETQYCARILEQLDVALTRRNPEYAGLVVADSVRSNVLGVLLFGPLSGTSGVVKIHALAGAEVELMMALLDSLLAASAERADRTFVCEIADDVPYVSVSGALTGRAFTREGRIEDYVRDGIALDILVWRS